MSINQKKIIMNAFISAQFSYCPLCHSRSLNTKINKIHERALRIVYDNSSSFDILLEKSKSEKIHHVNFNNSLQISKVFNNLSPFLMSDLFSFRNTDYNLRGGSKRTSNTVKTVYGTESISNLAPKIWEQVPDEIKDSKSLNTFKLKIKSLVPNSCPCRICKIYVPNVDSISLVTIYCFFLYF